MGHVAPGVAATAGARGDGGGDGPVGGADASARAGVATRDRRAATDLRRRAGGARPAGGGTRAAVRALSGGQYPTDVARCGLDAEGGGRSGAQLHAGGDVGTTRPDPRA